VLSPVAQAILFGLAGIALAALAALGRTKAFLFACGFLVPLVVPKLSLGISVEWNKIIGPLALALCVLRRRAPASGRALRSWAPFFGYTIAVSTVWMFFEYNSLHRYHLAEQLDLGEAQGFYKMPVQLGSFLGQMLTVLVVPAWASRKSDALVGLKGLISGTLFSAGVGVLHFLVTGQGTLTFASEHGQIAIGSLDLSRLGGISGEPKRLGACLVVLVVLGFCHWLFGRGAEQKRFSRSSLLALLGLIATFSTSAWAGLVAAILAAAGIGLVRAPRTRVAWLVASLAALALLGASTTLATEVVQKRFTDRLFGDSSRLSEQKDNYVLRAMADEPGVVLTGYGLGGGDLEALPYISWEEAAYKRTPTPGTTGVRLLGDLGVAGLLILGWVVHRSAKRFYAHEFTPVGAFVAVGFVAVMFCSMIALSSYLFAFGAVLACAEMAEEIPSPAGDPQTGGWRPAAAESA